MSTAVLEAQGVSKVFGRGDLAVHALHPADVSLYRGEVLVVMGPSGSGKTTLLSILGLVLAPTEGSVRVEGTLVRYASSDALARLRRDKVGFIFQQFNLLSGLTAIDNVALPLLLRGLGPKERRARARRALDLVAMADKLDAKPRHLSVGQQQRVAIARALVAEAGVLLCDEPTASLDSASGTVVLDTLKNLAKTENRAVVVVTHDTRVLKIADRLVHVEDGRTREANRHAEGTTTRAAQ